MSVMQRGTKFEASVGSRGNRWRKLFNTRQEAEIAELEEKLRRKSQPKAKTLVVGPPRKTLKEACDRTFFLHWKGQPSEWTNVTNSSAVLAELGPGRMVSDVTSDSIVSMVKSLERQGNTGSTINKKLSCLSMILKTAREQWPGSVPVMPVIPRRKEGAHRVRWMDEKEEARVLEACNILGFKDLHDYIVVAIDTGLRRGELLRFQVNDYYNTMLHLYDGETKSGKGRNVPATARVHDIIESRRGYRYLFEGFDQSTLRSQWAQIKIHLGLADDPQFVVHMLRHTCASRLVQRGVPLKVVQEWMGHSTINTTMRYAHLSPTSLDIGRQALEKVYPAT